MDTATGGLDTRVRDLAAGNAYQRQPRFRPLGPYRQGERERLATAGRTIADDAYGVHEKALAAAQREHGPREAGWSVENVTWLLARTGPAGAGRLATHLGWHKELVQRRGGVLLARARLFPNLDVTIAYLLLFGIYSGIVGDGIAGLGLSDLDWAGDATILLSYVKRRTWPESITLPKNGTATGTVAKPQRPPAFVTARAQREQLWLWVNRQGAARIYSGAIGATAIRKWGQGHDIRGDAEDADYLRIPPA